jgi:hypothetical protein
VRGDFAEDVAGENAHLFAAWFDWLKCIAGAGSCWLRGKELGDEFGARQLGGWLCTPCKGAHTEGEGVARPGSGRCEISVLGRD